MTTPRASEPTAASPEPAPQVPPIPPVPLGAGECFILTAAGFAVYQTVASAAWTLDRPVLGLTLGAIAGGILPLAVLLWVRRLPLRRMLGERPRWRDLGLAVWIVVSAMPLLYTMAGAVAQVFPPSEAQLALYRALVPGGWLDVGWGGLAVVVVAPLAEEILFRGLLLRGTASLMSVPIAVVCGGVLFGASHGALWLVLPLAGLGVLLGWLVWRTRGLAAAWLGHALFNLVAYADLCITHDVRGARLEAWATRPWVWIPATAVMLWGLARLRRGLPDATDPGSSYLRD